MYRILKLFEFIKFWIYNKKEFLHLKTLLKSTKREDILNKTIVFNTVRSIKVAMDRELFLSKLLAQKGAKVKILLDDGILEHWDSKKFDDLLNSNSFNSYHLNPSKKYKLNNNIRDLIDRIYHHDILRSSLKTYGDVNIEFIFYSKILKSDKYNFDNLHDLEKFAKSSTIRFFKTSNLNYNDELVKKYYKLSLRNAIMSRAIGNYVLENIKPDLYISSHGIYSTWGPAFEFLKKEIKSFIYSGIHSHSLDIRDIYFTDTVIQTLSRSSFWDKYKDVKVTSNMKEKVDLIIKKRTKHRSKDTKIYYNGQIASFKVDKNDDYKYHIAIFPSLMWDGNINERHIAFDGILDWLYTTIRYFENRTDVKVYLKFHPAEVSMFKKSPKIQDLITEHLNLGKIKNIILIPSEKKIDPYEFLKSGIDLGICYDGFLAIEMPLLKIPVILAGVGGRFTVDGGNFTIRKREDYFKYLDNLEQIIKDFHENYSKYYDSIVRYAYWYLYENVVKLPTLSSKYLYATDLLKLTVDDLILSKKMLQLFK